MSFYNWIRDRIKPHSDYGTIETKAVDSFADEIQLELKAVVRNAITKAIENIEGQYMRSVLDQSYFELDALLIKTLDANTGRETERFLNLHEAIHPSFRKQFFAKVIRAEYKSTRGSQIKVRADLVPEVELVENALDSLTHDEAFVISLKGRPVRFSAVANLAGPYPRTSYKSISIESLNFNGSTSDEILFGTGPIEASNISVRVTIEDKNGKSETHTKLPLVLGRDVNRYLKTSKGTVNGLNVNSTYVSRQQVFIFELFDAVYCLVPLSASLGLKMENGATLQPGTFTIVEADKSMRLLTGASLSSEDETKQQHNRDDFAVITLTAMSTSATYDSATPRPTASV
tara:strand:+ start:7377 stop:8411 length:1035 start_codon:yes stop_codon:yes gene_type:complete